ncbi:MAG: hypothetical protein MK212_16420 [Saprospiraceae bacterium]|nr:hypothetical protein [Saprospiraceae bacterium]
MNLKDLHNSISLGDFIKAERICRNLSIEEIHKAITAMNCQCSVVFYGFYGFLLEERRVTERAEIHYYMAVFLSTSLCSIEGAYQVSKYHILCAVKLDPVNIKYKEYLSFIESIPDISWDKGEDVLKKILLAEYDDVLDYYINTDIKCIYLEVSENASKYADDIVYYGLFLTLILDSKLKKSSTHFYTSLLLSENLHKLVGFTELALYHIEEALKYKPHDSNFIKQKKMILTKKSGILRD